MFGLLIALVMTETKLHFVFLFLSSYFQEIDTLFIQIAYYLYQLGPH